MFCRTKPLRALPLPIAFGILSAENPVSRLLRMALLVATVVCSVPEARGQTPLTAPFPHDRTKNRYISFDPNKATNDGLNIAFKVEIKQITLGSCSGSGGFCRLDRKVCTGSGDGCITDGDCDAGETCSIWSDCNACSVDGNHCIDRPIDCNPGQSCVPTGQACINDAPDVGGTSVGRVWWIGPESPLGNSVHLMVSEPFRKVSADWPNPTHVGDCEIVPRAAYGVRAINVDTGAESEELLIETTRFAPRSASHWGDGVGLLESHCTGNIQTPQCASDADCTPPQTCDRVWMPPDGTVNFGEEFQAVLWLMNPVPGSVLPHITWVDLHGNGSGTPGGQNFDPPNYIVNFSDIQQLVFAFQGRPYAFYDPADCPDEPDWP